MAAVAYWSTLVAIGDQIPPVSFRDTARQEPAWTSSHCSIRSR